MPLKPLKITSQVIGLSGNKFLAGRPHLLQRGSAERWL